MTRGPLREVSRMPRDMAPLALADYREAFRQAQATADRDPADDFALWAADAAADRLFLAAGHESCRGWWHDPASGLFCECGAPLDSGEATP